MIYLLLCMEFFRIGLFSFGGGYATIPFLYGISQAYGWYSPEELTRMIAIASMTPGPVGINTATYAGLKSADIAGAVLATVSEMLPSLFLVIFVAKLLKKFSGNFYVKSMLETLKPVSCALLISVAAALLSRHAGDIKGIILFVLLFFAVRKIKLSPTGCILFAAAMGLAVQFV